MHQQQTEQPTEWFRFEFMEQLFVVTTSSQPDTARAFAGEPRARTR